MLKLEEINEKNQKEIHDLFKKAIDKYNLPVVYLTGTVDQRVETLWKSVLGNVCQK